MKAKYLSCFVQIGGELYTVHLRVASGRAPAHVGADSPRFMDPGRPPRATVIRILREGVDVGSELTYFTRRKVESEALRIAAGGSAVSSPAEVPPPFPLPAFFDVEEFR